MGILFDIIELCYIRKGEYAVSVIMKSDNIKFIVFLKFLKYYKFNIREKT